MDIDLFNDVASALPRMNEDICSGLATKQMLEAERYIHENWIASSSSYPKELTYIGYERCTPYEAFRELTRQKKRGRLYDLSRSDLYMCKYKFAFNGKEMRPRYMLLPYFSDGGTIYLKGTLYRLLPVYGGRIMNVENDRVYIQGPRVRLAFGRMSHSVVENGYLVHGDIVHGRIHQGSTIPSTSKKKCLMFHYLCADKGLTRVMQEHFGIPIEIGYQELDNSPSDYLVYRSSGENKLSSNKRLHVPSPIRIKVEKKYKGTLLHSLMCSLFYILDVYPDAMTKEDLEDPDMWLRLLTRFIFKDNKIEAKRFREMQRHKRVIEEYMDKITRRLLMLDGIDCTTTYDLFTFLVKNYNDLVIHSDMGSMYKRELSTVRHVLYDIVYNIFNLMFQLEQLVGEDKITEDKINGKMDRELSRDKIYQITKHREFVSDGIAGDCKPYFATAQMMSQQRASMSNRAASKHIDIMKDPSMLLHYSQIETSTYSMMSKADPTGRSRCNPFVNFGIGYYMEPRPGEYKKYLEDFRDLIAR